MNQNQIKKKPYLYAVGRRKTAIARVRFYAGNETGMKINGMEVSQYFPSKSMVEVVNSPCELAHKKEAGRFDIKVLGGGKSTQSESIRHGIARILIQYEPELRVTLKKAGFLRRDPREKERKKPGLKKARRAPQWQKR